MGRVHSLDNVFYDGDGGFNIHFYVFLFNRLYGGLVEGLE
ncbi:hypothetical protein X559_1982 [Paenilisteria newyorkensis]|nr:hypothetical protein X559_1982 [Listeria newyorkensis]